MVGMRRAFLGVVLIMGIVFSGGARASCSEDKGTVYYFHGGARCSMCHKMEQYAREAVEENFKDELADGTLVFEVVDVEEAGNEHFMDDYQLYTKALVLSLTKDGQEVRYKNLAKIWEYAGDKEMFFDYVVREVREFLRGEGSDG